MIYKGADYQCSIVSGSEFQIPKIADNKPEPLYDTFDAKGAHPHLNLGQRIRTNF